MDTIQQNCRRILRQINNLGLTELIWPYQIKSNQYLVSQNKESLMTLEGELPKNRAPSNIKKKREKKENYCTHVL